METTLLDRIMVLLKKEYVGLRVRKYAWLGEDGSHVQGEVTDVMHSDGKVILRIRYGNTVEDVPSTGLINYRLAEEPMDEKERRFAEILDFRRKNL